MTSFIQIFDHAITNTMNKYMPVKSCKLKSNEKPWITPLFCALIAKRQRAILSGDMTKYKVLRNRIKSTKWEYHYAIHSIGILWKKCVLVTKNWWQTIKKLTGLDNKANEVQGIANNICEGDLTKLAHLLNDGFTKTSADLKPSSSQQNILSL